MHSSVRSNRSAMLRSSPRAWLIVIPPPTLLLGQIIIADRVADPVELLQLLLRDVDDARKLLPEGRDDRVARQPVLAQRGELMQTHAGRRHGEHERPAARQLPAPQEPVTRAERRAGSRRLRSRYQA